MARRKVIYANGVEVEEEFLPQGPNGAILWNGKEYGTPEKTNMTALNSDGELVDIYTITGIPSCDITLWKQVSRTYRQDLLKDRPVGFFKYRLKLIYEVANQRLKETPNYPLNIDFTQPTAKIKQVLLIDNLRETALIEGFHYTISGRGYVWFNGTWPYPEIKMMIDWVDTTTNEARTSEYITNPVLDNGYGGAAEKRSNIFTITQSGQSALYSEDLNFVASLYGTPGINSIVSSNPLGMWKEPLIYTINEGECFVEVDIDGTLKYFDSDMIETTAQEILDNSRYGNPFSTGLNINGKSVKEFKTGEYISGKPAIGLFQVVAPNEPRLNFNIKNSNLTALSGIEYVTVKPKGFAFRTYLPIPVNTPDTALDVGTTFYVDNRRIEPVPYRRCFEGLRTEYVIREEFEVSWEREQPCISDIANPPVMQYSSSIETEEILIVDWEGQRANRELPDCECLQVRVLKEPVEEQNDQCGCRQITRADIYTICPDTMNGTLYAQYESRIRVDGGTTFLTPPPNMNPTLTRIEKIEKCKDKPMEERTEFTYHKIDTNDILIGNMENVVTGLFNISGSLDCYATNSIQTGSTDYYYNITGCDACGSSSYFAVSYGHFEGSGSTYDSQYLYESPSKVVYSQNKLIALEDIETKFTFYNTGSVETPKDVYFIRFYRESFDDSLDPGNFEVSLRELNGKLYANNVYTGSNVAVSSSNKIITLIDNSAYINENICKEDPYASYDLVSGSLSNGAYITGTGSLETNAQYTVYGKIYPSLGLIALNGNRLNQELSFNSVSGSNVVGDNSYKLYTAISGAASLDYSMKARKVRDYGVSHYLIRVPHSEATFTNNPSSLTTNGRFKYECMAQNPTTYISSIGLYNDNKELLAIAKFNRPVRKEYDDDLFIKIKMAK